MIFDLEFDVECADSSAHCSDESLHSQKAVRRHVCALHKNMPLHSV